MYRRPKKRVPSGEGEGEFLWLISLSDLMILLFIFFVVLYAFAHKKLKQSDYAQILEAFGNKKVKDPIKEVRDKIAQWIKDKNLADQIEVKLENGQVFVEIKDKVLFSSGEYAVSTQGRQTLLALAQTLEQVPEGYQVGIEGHTDDVPITTKEISNNFELSTKRALSVYNSMILPDDVRNRTIIMGYGETKPRYPHRDEMGKPIVQNRSKNRRVTVRIF